MPLIRPIPDDVNPAVEQALLNMYLGATAEQIKAARADAVSQGDRINKAYDKWLRDRRNATAVQHSDYNGERRRAIARNS